MPSPAPPAPKPWPAPPAPAPIQITLNAYDLLWLAMGGTINDAGGNVQIRFDSYTVRTGAFHQAMVASESAPNLSPLAKATNAKITSTAGFPAGGSAPTNDDLYAAVQSAQNEETVYSQALKP